MPKRDEPRDISTAPSAVQQKRPRSKAADEALKKAQAARRASIARKNEQKARGEKSRLQMYKDGELPISEWTEEELKRGRPANLGGTFEGNANIVRLSSREYQALRAELLKRGQRMLDSMYHDAVKVLHEIAVDPVAPEAARVKAANLIVERAAGKVVERVEIKSSDPWQDILDDVLNDEVLKPVKEPSKKSV
jgi:hypothetical protein